MRLRVLRWKTSIMSGISFPYEPKFPVWYPIFHLNYVSEYWCYCIKYEWNIDYTWSLPSIMNIIYVHDVPLQTSSICQKVDQKKIDSLIFYPNLAQLWHTWVYSYVISHHNLHFFTNLQLGHVTMIFHNRKIEFWDRFKRNNYLYCNRYIPKRKYMETYL